MHNFTWYNPTKIIFGKDVIDQIGDEASKIGTKAIILIGKGSVKKSGLYARIISLLNSASIKHITVEGIKSNPIYQDADNAVTASKEFGAEMVIAIGGGSVIDTAKAVAAGHYSSHSVWDFYMLRQKPINALPMLCVLTLAATGTESNPYTVLQDDESGMKRGWGAPPLTYPKVAFLDPQLTYSVPADYTSYGIADLMAHSFELFFGNGQSDLSDYYIASILKLALKHGKVVIEDPNNYDARANIMWLATNALNGSLGLGKQGGDWGCHGIEHSLSVLYDIPHGAGLSIVYPAWLKFHKEKLTTKLAFLARNVFDITEQNEAKAADQFIADLEDFFTSIHTPIRLKEVDIHPTEKEKILANLKLNNVSGGAHKLGEAEHKAIIELMW